MPRAGTKAKKDKLPSLEHRYEYRSKRRCTPDGIALEARGGDRELISRLAEYGSILMERAWKAGDSELSAYAWWLADILGEIGNGTSPNEAFGWSGAKDRWKIHNGESWEHVSSAYHVGKTVETLITNLTGKSCQEAMSYLADIFHVNLDDCREQLTSIPAGKKKLTKGDAKELALDAVAAFGACGRVVARDTAAGYYRELVETRGNN